LNRVFHAAGVMLVPDSSPLAVQTALDAMAAGARVVCRRPDEPFERLYPDLADLEPYFNFYRTTSELLSTMSRLATQTDPTSDSSAAARSAVRSEHTVARRLIAIVDTMRRCQHAGR
jgi:hypothetical protein